MSTGRVLAFVVALLAGLQAAVAQDGVRLSAHDVLSGARPGERIAQRSDQEVIPPSMALRVALRYSPDSQGLDVTLVEDGRPVYAVKLKTGNRVHRILVDARTGQIIGD